MMHLILDGMRRLMTWWIGRASPRIACAPVPVRAHTHHTPQRR
jgi:hypothetical protein